MPFMFDPKCPCAHSTHLVPPLYPDPDPDPDHAPLWLQMNSKEHWIEMFPPYPMTSAATQNMTRTAMEYADLEPFPVFFGE